MINCTKGRVTDETVVNVKEFGLVLMDALEILG